MNQSFFKILFATALIIFTLGIILVPKSFAVDVISPACKSATNASNQPAICKDNSQFQRTGTNPIFGPGSLLTTVVNVLSLAAGVISIFVIIIGAAKMITSAGDSNSIASARRTILYAVISLVIVASAQLIVRFILSKL